MNNNAKVESTAFFIQDNPMPYNESFQKAEVRFQAYCV